jgi:hypothetical protein
MRNLWSIGIVLYFGLSLVAFSQSTNATVGGTVQDASRAFIPGVTITATNTATGIVTTVLTNEAGVFQFPSLQPGTYELQASLPGFNTVVYKDLQLGGADQARRDFTLEVGAVATTVDVTTTAGTAISSNSVGAVLGQESLDDLPLSNRNVLEHVGTTAGVQGNNNLTGIFAGGRLSMANTTRDGFNVGDNGRSENGVFSVTHSSPDLIEEVSIVTSPIDPQTSRGVGQVRLITRHGTNAFAGSVFWVNHNSAADANNWFNNANGIKKNYDNRNQFGVRVSGPIVRNRTFFFFLFEGQRDLKRESATGNVLTAMARQGIFRYFPGVNNANASLDNATVDRIGNPLRPAAATGDLSAIDLFGNCTFSGAPVPSCRPFRDPLRPALNNSPFMQDTLRRMPLPNDFTGGDGLNVALIRFTRRVEGLDFATGTGSDVNRDQYNARIDHRFNANHKLSLVGTKEKTWAFSGQAVQRSWPDGFDGLAIRRPDVYTMSFTSVLSSSLLNEFRAGRRRSVNLQYAPANRPDAAGAEALKAVPVLNGIPFQVVPVNWTFLTYGGHGRWRRHSTPMITIGDDLSWTHGKHAFKGGIEWRNSKSSGYADPGFTPMVSLGAPAITPVSGLDENVYPGLLTNTAGTARSLLTDLTASVGRVNQSFGIASATDTLLRSSPEMQTSYYGQHQREVSAYFKDDWKLRPGLTLNLGVHFEYYGQIFEDNGLAARVVGNDERALTSVTCTSNPGTPGFTSTCTDLTEVQFVGRNSTHPDLTVNLKGNDLNNWAPTVGFSWNVPWFGGKTVLRSGYGISYHGAQRNFATVDSTISSVPGITLVGLDNGVSYTPPTHTSLSTLTLPIPRPAGVPARSPFIVPTTDRTLTIQTFNRVAPYIQNWNLEVQREIARNTTVEVRYVATKGTRLRGTLDLNQIDALHRNRDLFDAFNAVRGGGESPLLNQMLQGINLGGQVVNGTTWTGAMAVRTNTTTRGLLANGNVGAFVNFLNTSPTGPGSSPGAILRRNGFPENYISVNPQFARVQLLDNPASSTYHALQAQITRRAGRAFTTTTTWTWSKALGESAADPGTMFRDPTNRSLERTNISFDRTHQITSHAIYELPLGVGRLLLGGAPGWVQQLVAKWQLGGVLNYNSGAPLSITSNIGTISTVSAQPNVVAVLPEKMGNVTKVSKGVRYFNGLTQKRDPGFENITALNDLGSGYSNLAIVDPNGQVVLVNPQPGEVGTLGYSSVKGPKSLSLDMNAIKRFQITERTQFELRVDAINVLNRPNFGNPITAINSPAFGQITTAGGARSFVLNTRINF